MLRLVGVKKRFGARVIFEGISAHVEPSNALALIGPSGSGKTTLLRLIAGLERLDAGAIHIAGRCVSSSTIHIPPESRELNMVFQDFALWPHMRAVTHLEFVLRNRKMPKAERMRRAEEMLHWLGLTHCSKAYPGQMSGGEQQRLAIARGLITEPRILLLDEPFSNLNATWRDTIVEKLLQIMREGTVLVVATHNPADIAEFNAQSLEFQ